jgi:hypothetical protein
MDMIRQYDKRKRKVAWVVCVEYIFGCGMPVELMTTARIILNLHLLQTVLPESGVGGNTIIAEVDENVHGVAVHGLTHEHVVVVVVAEDLLDGSGGTALEGLDGLFAGALLLELVVDTLNVG